VQTINIHEAKPSVALLEQVAGGEIIIAKAGKPIAVCAAGFHRKSVSLVCSKANLMSG